MELLGKVPEHWEVRRLKYAVSFTGGGTPSKTNASFWRGRIPWVSPKDMTRNRLSDTADHITEAAVAASAASIVAAGAVLVVVRSGILRRKIPVAINTVPMAVNQDMKAMRPRKRIMSEYLRGLIQGNQSFWLSEWTKQGATVESIEHRLLANSRIPIPPLPEQHAIARFLDAADRRIRRYIRAKERLVELLEERKRALIHEAVTGRIDVRTGQPYPAYKDSGVEWLGKVPEHWEVSRVKTEFHCLNRRRIPLSGTQRGAMKQREYDYYGASGVIDKVDDYLFDDTLLLIAEDGANLVLRNLPLAIIARGKFWVNNHAHILKPKRSHIEFLGSVMENLSYLPWISGAAQPKLTQDRLMSIAIAVPPRLEQDQIVDSLAATTVAITSAAKDAERQIGLLREYRTRLIADVVTGKLDVRETAPRLPETDPLAGDRDGADAILTESRLHSTAHDMAKEAIP